MTKTKGAIDFDECLSIQAPRRCLCGTCQVCGYEKHMAIHGPYYGQPPGSKPWGHEFVSAKRAAWEELKNG